MAIDNGVHILLHCPSWAVESRNLFALGLYLDLDREYDLVIMGSSEAWTAFACFCETVMRSKEEAERDREKDRRVRMVHPLVPSLLSQYSDSS